jgi:hypothetical protein
MVITSKCNGVEQFEERMRSFWNSFGPQYETVVWGCGKTTSILIDAIRGTHSIAYVVDSDSSKWGTLCCGYNVRSPDTLKRDGTRQIRVFIMPFGFVRHDIIKSLEDMGFGEQHYCFGHEYLVVHSYLTRRQLVVPNIGFFIGSACSLKCRDCLAHLPHYRKNQKTFQSLEDVKRDIDITFSRIHFVNLITLSTGEIFLHPEIDGIFGHLNEYRAQFNYIQTPTNGTILPKEATLKLMRECGFGVYISDYSHAIGSRSKIPALVTSLEEHMVPYELFSDLQGGKAETPIWSDIGSLMELRDRSDEDTARTYDRCSNRLAQVVFNGQLYSCGSAQWGEFGGLYESTTNDRTDLNAPDLEVLMAYLGVTESGFPAVCRRCNGVGPAANQHTVTAGLQAQK